MNDTHLETPLDLSVICIPKASFVDERDPQKTVNNPDYFIRRRTLGDMIDIEVIKGIYVIVKSDPITVDSETVGKQMQINIISFRDHEIHEKNLAGRKVE